MFLAGVGPGILLSCAFAAAIWLLARFRPSTVFETRDTGAYGRISAGEAALKAIPILALVTIVLGGLYGGFLNPTEAGAVGALGALVVALLRRSLTGRSFWNLLLETGQITVSVLFLIMSATFFSRMLAMSGLPADLAGRLLAGPLGPYGFLFVYLGIIILLGCIIDSISIMLIMLPIALPVAQAAGFDMIWFGVLTVVAVEVGLLTPPFGLSVYTIRSAIDDDTLKVGLIFRGALPFVATMLVMLLILIAFPPIATWLARL
jgi:tripartite ATP-independent transporter DctM subunit